MLKYGIVAKNQVVERFDARRRWSIGKIAAIRSTATWQRTMAVFEYIEVFYNRGAPGI